MKKIKQLIVKHWINVALFLLVGIVTWFSIRYALKYSNSAKTTNDIRAIWQLALTAIAGSVGVGTIINSARSASTAAESVRLTREKDLREQSSHLIIVSPVGGFPIELPHYSSRVSPNLDVTRNSVSNGILLQSINNARETRLQSSMPYVDFSLVNSGKGACLNLEYEFKITNVEKFQEYVFKFDEQDVLKEFVSYVLEINKLNSSFFEVNIINEWMRKAMIHLGEESNIALVESTDSYKVKIGKVKRYYEIVKSEETLKLIIPPGFIILCRQYLLVNHLKSLIKEIYKNKNIPEELNSVLHHEAIKPEAEITLSYHNESDIRNGNYDFSKKTVELHSLRLIELNDYDVKDEFSYFLEISPLKKSKSKKNESTAK